jgi:hypothetical protein
VKELFKLVLESVHFLVLLSPSNDIFPMQTVFENSLMQHHVALPPDAMGKITFIASPGQYSLKVCLSNFFSMESIIIVKIRFILNYFAVIVWVLFIQLFSCIFCDTGRYLLTYMRIFFQAIYLYFQGLFSGFILNLTKG